MNNSSETITKESWLDRPIIPALPKVTLEHLLITVILVLAVISRFYILGARVMSHDEVNHVVPSYDLYLGTGYSHDPVTHGPLQFHLLAASYFLFGDSDFSSRIPSALFSIATIAFVLFAWRRYLGRTGALLAGFFFLISPYMLFYGRYTRNESFVGLFSVVLLYAVLHYLEKGNHRTIYLYTIFLSLYYCTKETSFIFTAEMLIFLAFVFLKEISQLHWKKPRMLDGFILSVIITLLLVGVALGAGVMGAKFGVETTDAVSTTGIDPAILNTATIVSVALAAMTLLFAAFMLLSGFGWRRLRSVRSFDLILLTLTLILPQLIAFPISWLGWNPIDYSQQGLIRTSIALVVAVLVSLAIGLLWKPAIWLKNAVVFYAIFTVFYTTMFTNGQGFFTGLVGSLGYWLSQQSVNRGTQPWYYYPLIQIPMYEYLAALGTLLTIILAFRHKVFSSVANLSPADQIAMEKAEEAAKIESELEAAGFASGFLEEAESQEQIENTLESDADLIEIPDEESKDPKKLPVVALLIYWTFMSLIAFTVAGEKMPWLTVHIALPMLLASGFGIGYLVDTLIEQKWNYKSALSLLLFPVFLVSFAKVIGSLIGSNKPFAGMELVQLQQTSTFLLSIIAAALSGWGIFELMKGWEARTLFKTLVVTFFSISAVLTARSAFQASYINYDNGKEFLVYAHAARGPKDVLEQVEDISTKTTGGKDIKVAYIGDALYPYWWYFRDYSNKIWYKDKLTHELSLYTAVISDDTYVEKTRAILDNDYYEFKYKRLVWPMQDYMNQSFKSAWTILKDPEMLSAIFDIWLNKDYTHYASIKGLSSLTVENWEPSGNIYLFVKKDVVASIWSYGTLPTISSIVEVDPYETKMTSLTPDKFFGSIGTAEGQFDTVHDIAIGKNGDIYVTDSRNNRIQRFSSDGQFLGAWGSFGSVDAGAAPGGTFNEPWGIAVAPDGSVYVTDTWNYRIQKFTADGQFVTMWGTAGTGDAPDAFWGPRGIVVNSKGQVFVTDTGNNRVVIFDKDGVYLNQFGLNGISSGEFDEPVGLAVDDQDNIYVVDTWNKRIQVFEEFENSNVYQYLREWEVSAWDGQSINNKPFIDVDQRSHVFVTDPDDYRVLEFNDQGEFIRGWGNYSSGIDGFGQPIGIAVDEEGYVWVSDAENGYILRFSMPADPVVVQSSLPAFPASASVLTYDESTGQLLGPDGQNVYRLDVDGLQWVPVIPLGISDLIAPGAMPRKIESGEWQLYKEDGSLAFKWQPDLLLWIADTSSEPTLSETE